MSAPKPTATRIRPFMVRACAAFAFIRHHRMRIWVRQFDALVSSGLSRWRMMSDEIDNPEVMGDADAADDGITSGSQSRAVGG